MSGLTHIKRIVLAQSSIEYLYDHLRKAGKEGVEAVALWAGTQSDSTFEITNTIIPAQTGYRTEDGLLYSVEGDELHRINIWLYQNKMTLMAQIHSHPAEAYHSETDDRYPIVAVLGGLSVVIPNFGFNPISTADWAVYRLFSAEGWVEISKAEVSNLIQIQY